MRTNKIQKINSKDRFPKFIQLKEESNKIC